MRCGWHVGTAPMLGGAHREGPGGRYVLHQLMLVSLRVRTRPKSSLEPITAMGPLFNQVRGYSLFRWTFL